MCDLNDRCVSETLEREMKELVDRIVAVNDWVALRKLRVLADCASREMLDKVTDHLMNLEKKNPIIAESVMTLDSDELS